MNGKDGYAGTRMRGVQTWEAFRESSRWLWEPLLKIIHSTGVFKGENALAVFDTALRLACRATPSGKKCPAKIYLHRGTKTGAEKFCKESIRETVNQRDYLEKSELIPELANSDLNEYELEDVLCIYKS